VALTREIPWWVCTASFSACVVHECVRIIACLRLFSLVSFEADHQVCRLWSCHRLRYIKNTSMPLREDCTQARLSAMATVGMFRCGAEFLKLVGMEYGKLQVSSVTTAVLMLLDNGGMPDTLHGFWKMSERLGRITTLTSPC
jgi:hypothetical protein